jgi:hypothetical protein
MMDMRRAGGRVDVADTSSPRRDVAPGDGGVTTGVPSRTGGSVWVGATSRMFAPGDARNRHGLKSASDE